MNWQKLDEMIGSELVPRRCCLKSAYTFVIICCNNSIKCITLSSPELASSHDRVSLLSRILLIYVVLVLSSIVLDVVLVLSSIVLINVVLVLSSIVLSVVFVLSSIVLINVVLVLSRYYLLM